MSVNKGEVDQLFRWGLCWLAFFLVAFWIRDQGLIPDGNTPLIIAILILLFVAWRYNIRRYSGR